MVVTVFLFDLKDKTSMFLCVEGGWIFLTGKAVSYSTWGKEWREKLLFMWVATPVPQILFYRSLCFFGYCFPQSSRIYLKKQLNLIKTIYFTSRVALQCPRQTIEIVQKGTGKQKGTWGSPALYLWKNKQEERLMLLKKKPRDWRQVFGPEAKFETVGDYVPRMRVYTGLWRSSQQSWPICSTGVTMLLLAV